MPGVPGHPDRRLRAGLFVHRQGALVAAAHAGWRGY